ncbi:hypothetical protein ABT288_15195 [Streptomyces sp. NPDC001093]|uniref:hypothetical protein n=1 Tax=Streptomyces sp. NPDC001093 TaxID=3154376 RepID=UPI0033191708
MIGLASGKVLMLTAYECAGYRWGQEVETEAAEPASASDRPQPQLLLEHADTEFLSHFAARVLAERVQLKGITGRWGFC